MGAITEALKALNAPKKNSINEQKVIDALDKSIAATNLANKYAHTSAQNEYRVSTTKVEHQYEICKNSNMLAKQMVNIVGGKYNPQDCLKPCTDFNHLTEEYNKLHNFSGELAFAYAQCD